MCKTKEMAGGKYECPLLTPQHCSGALPLKQQLMYFSQGGLRAALEIKGVPLQLNMCWSFLLSERVIKVSLLHLGGSGNIQILFIQEENVTIRMPCLPHRT